MISKLKWTISVTVMSHSFPSIYSSSSPPRGTGSPTTYQPSEDAGRQDGGPRSLCVGGSCAPDCLTPGPALYLPPSLRKSRGSIMEPPLASSYVLCPDASWLKQCVKTRVKWQKSPGLWRMGHVPRDEWARLHVLRKRASLDGMNAPWLVVSKRNTESVLCKTSKEN